MTEGEETEQDYVTDLVNELMENDAIKMVLYAMVAFLVSGALYYIGVFRK